MCITCGCSDNDPARVTLLENGETIDNGDGDGNSNHHHTHTHTLADGTVITHNHEEDKPIKYPHMFRASQVAILTKIDLLPYLEFNVDRCVEYARQVNPYIQIFQVSSTTGTGLNDWYQWLLSVNS